MLGQINCIRFSTGQCTASSIPPVTRCSSRILPVTRCSSNILLVTRGSSSIRPVTRCFSSIPPLYSKVLGDPYAHVPIYTNMKFSCQWAFSRISAHVHLLDERFYAHGLWLEGTKDLMNKFPPHIYDMLQEEFAEAFEKRVVELMFYWPDFKNPYSEFNCYMFTLREWLKHGKSIYNMPADMYLDYVLEMMRHIPPSFGLEVGKILSLNEAIDQASKTMKNFEFFGRCIGADVSPEFFCETYQDLSIPSTILEIRPNFKRFPTPNGEARMIAILPDTIFSCKVGCVNTHVILPSKQQRMQQINRIWTVGPFPGSKQSTHTPGDGITTASNMQHVNSVSKSMMMYGGDGAAGIASSTNQLDDLEIFCDVGSLEDNVGSFLSLDGGDGNMYESLKQSLTEHKTTTSKEFSFGEVGCIRTRNKVTCCHFSSGGMLLASAGHDKKAVLWNMDTLQTESALEEDQHLITDARFWPITSQLSTASFDKSVRLLDAANPSYCLQAYKGHTSHVMSLDFHPKKNDLFCFGDSKHEIRYWSISPFTCTCMSKQGGSAQVRFQPSVHLLAAASGKVVSILDDRRTHSFQGHSGAGILTETSWLLSVRTAVKFCH